MGNLNDDAPPGSVGMELAAVSAEEDLPLRRTESLDEVAQNFSATYIYRTYSDGKLAKNGVPDLGEYLENLENCFVSLRILKMCKRLRQFRKADRDWILFFEH